MKLRIDFAKPVWEEKEAAALTCDDLNDFYAAASETERLDLFFMLLATLHRFEEAGEKSLAAHLSFLTAYYLFVPLTPPASCRLALHYIKKAIRLDPKPLYKEWQALIEKGN